MSAPSPRSTDVHVPRPRDSRAWAEVDLAALDHNVRCVRRALPEGTRLLAVLKADAYGMGAVPIAWQALAAGIDALGVGDSAEALELRRAGIQAPILVLGGIVRGEIERVVTDSIEVCIHSEDRLRDIGREAWRQGRGVAAHLKVDTGMGRLGVRPDRALELARKIASHSSLRLAGVCTHLAGTAGGPDAENLRQLERFRAVADAVQREGLGEPVFHALATPNLELQEAAFVPGAVNMVRPGLALHGLAPAASDAAQLDLRPILSLRTQVIFLKDVAAGSTLGYRRTHLTAEPTRIATIPFGYNDGLPMSLSNVGALLVRGEEAPLVGNVSMDYATLDVGHIRGVRVGDPVTFIGEDGARRRTLPDVAHAAGRSPHELLCSVGKRVERTYLAGHRARANAGS